MLAAATASGSNDCEVILQRPAEIALQDRAHVRPWGGRHAVLESAQLLRPGLGEQIESRREQLARLQECAAVAQARLDEAPRIARVQRVELRARDAFGHERRLDRVQPIARGDLREQPADARRAAAACRPALDLGAERARVVRQCRDSRRARSRRGRGSARRSRAAPMRFPRRPKPGRRALRTNCALRRCAWR